MDLLFAFILPHLCFCSVFVVQYTSFAIQNMVLWSSVCSFHVWLPESVFVVCCGPLKRVPVRIFLRSWGPHKWVPMSVFVDPICVSCRYVFLMCRDLHLRSPFVDTPEFQVIPSTETLTAVPWGHPPAPPPPAPPPRGAS